MAIATLTSMELDDEASMDAAMPIAMPDRPKWPYGLRICFTNDELEKLGIDPEDATVGGYFHLSAVACVTSVSRDEREAGEPCYRIEAQIEQMGVLGLDDGAEDEPQTQPRRSIYKTG